MSVLDFTALAMFADGASQFTFYNIVNNITIPGWVVIIVLTLQLVYLIAIGIERYLTYGKTKSQSMAYAPKVSQALKKGDLDEAIALGDKFKDSHLAMVVSSGLKEFQAGASQDGVTNETMEASKRALERAIAIKTAELKRGLSGLASVGSTAPFVGLLGTVIGIMFAFDVIATTKNAGIAEVGGKIAEALVATAYGIAVAVPGVWLFNWFSNKVTSFSVEMENSASELVDFFIKRRK
jgi:biopolymer transport protein ExbB/TolQ